MQGPWNPLRGLGNSLLGLGNPLPNMQGLLLQGLLLLCSSSRYNIFLKS